MDDRIVDLEMRFAFQQDLLDKLNEALTEQRDLMDDLERRLAAVEGGEETDGGEAS